MDQHQQWQRRRLMEQAATALEKNGFGVVLFDQRAEALAHLEQLAASADRIGFGGSMTLTALGLVERIEALGKTALVHGRAGLTPAERREVMRQQQGCDLFFTSTNALTLQGHLVNIDATGNRVCAMAFGPQRVVVVAGSNKLTGNLESALRRIKEEVAPPNAKRLNFDTPCAKTGRCSDCSSPQRICRITTIIERCPRATEVQVCLINETLGY
jgi:hypothetical protein